MEWPGKKAWWYKGRGMEPTAHCCSWPWYWVDAIFLHLSGEGLVDGSHGARWAPMEMLAASPRHPRYTCRPPRHSSAGTAFKRTSKLLRFPGGSVGKECACSAGDWGSIPGSGRSLGEGNGSPLQCSFLGNPMDRGAWQATVHGVTKARCG